MNQRAKEHAENETMQNDKRQQTQSRSTIQFHDKVAWGVGCNSNLGFASST